MGTEKETVPPRDWRTGAGYPPVKGTSMKRWAWEFLRRNSRYRNDWLILQALGGDLSPAELDAAHDRGWIQSYRPAVMGERWGLRQLVDPEEEYSIFNVQFLRVPGVITVGPGWEGFGYEEFPVKAADGGIAWRSARAPDGSQTWRAQEAVVLHYDRPLKPQLRAIEQHWARQRKRLLEGRVIARWPAKRNRAGPEGLLGALRALDASAAGVGPAEIGRALYPRVVNEVGSRCQEDRAARLVKKGEKLRDGEYRFLIWSVA